MTLPEKLGQLTLTSASMAETGPVVHEDLDGDIRRGLVGATFNIWGADAIAGLQRMAVEETRLGIPLFVGLDVIHGFRTIFPGPLTEAGAFDPALWQATARAAAAEAAAEGVDLTFAPMLDLCRDPRWGRIMEGPGEDPLVGSLFARAKVAGFQGARLSDRRAIAATAKHFVAYGASDAGRDYAPVDISERTLHDVYLPPFEAAVGAGVAAIMPAFTDIAGVPMTAHRPLLRDVLRRRWGFRGVIMTDYHATDELIAHGVAADLAEAAALCLNAGVDLDMMGDAYRHGLPEALSRGLVTEARIDAAVMRVLRLKQALGLFADPYRRCRGGLDTATRTAHRALAREAAVKSAVLLKNDGGLLPVADSARRIAVIGPLADAADDMLGAWSGAGVKEDVVSLLEGLRAGLPGREIVHVEGVPVEGGDTAGIPAAAEAARGADLVVLCVGERRWMSGEAACRSRLGLPGHQTALAEAVLAAGRPVVLVLASGRPLTVGPLIARAGAALAIGYPGVEAGPALATLLTGAAEPGGRLPVTWPRSEGQIPIFYAHRSGGRPPSEDDHFTSKWSDLPVTPEFPFGHGLGYAPVNWETMDVTPPAVAPGQDATVTVTLSNGGTRATETVVFLFLRLPVAPVARPVLELAGLARVTLAPGERRAVPVTLPAATLDRLAAAAGLPAGAPLALRLFAGPSADPARHLKGTLHRTAAG